MSSSELANESCFAAALSKSPDSARAIAEVCDGVAGRLGGSPDIVLVFVSHHHGPEFAPVAAGLHQKLQPKQLIGCTGEAIVSGAQEVENEPALALWAARLPQATVRTMHLQYAETSEGATFSGWPDDLPDEWPDGAMLVVLGDPFSFAVDAFLKRINEDHPGIPVVGGMASGRWGPNENRLLFGGDEVCGGAVAILMHGSMRVRTVVSQGCRPIGQHLVVTRANQNVIQELGGRPPLAHLKDLYASLSPREQKLIERGLHVGRAINEYKDRFCRGDFLIRNVIGADPGSGAIAITDAVRPGQTIQFHIRDADTADEDLHQLLGRVRADSASSPQAALLFTCNGRGSRLFGSPHHDAAALLKHLGDIPVAGFFAQGELGPIGGKNFIHGFTASVVVFEGAAHA